MPRLALPNSAACLMQLMVSEPALARPMTFGPAAAACTRKAEKTVVPGRGVRTWPSALTPGPRTTGAVSRSGAGSKAWSVVMEYQVEERSRSGEAPVGRDSIQVAEVQGSVVGEQAVPVRAEVAE